MSAPLNVSEITAATTAFVSLVATYNHRLRLNRKATITQVEKAAVSTGRRLAGEAATKVAQWAVSESTKASTDATAVAPVVSVDQPAVGMASPAVSAMPGAQTP